MKPILKSDNWMLCREKVQGSNKWLFFIAFLLPAAMMTFVCLLMGITPFGNDTFMIADMSKEYVEYIAYYKSVFRGENNFIYMFSKCLGGDALGIFVYYIMSPLLLPVYLLPLKWIPAGVTMVIITKIGICGLSMAYYLVNRFKPERRIPLLIFSTSYAFIGFSMANTFNFMWIDGVLMLPFVLSAIDNIIDGKKAIKYSIVLAVALILNYYIGYMICIACVLYFVSRMIAVWEKKTILCKLVRFAYGSLFGGGMAAFILVPIYFTLGGSLKDSANLHVGVTFPNLSPLQFFPKLFCLSYNGTEMMDGMPNIFCGFLMIALTGAYFANKKIPLRERAASAVFMGVIVVSMCIAKIDFAWHGFMEPSGYHYRYSFLLSFAMIAVSYNGVANYAENALSTVRICVVGAVLTILFAASFLLYRPSYITWQMAHPSMVFVLMILVLFGFYAKRGEVNRGNNVYRRRWSFVFLLIAMLQFADLGLNAVYTYMQNTTAYYTELDDYEKAIDRISPRVEYVKQQDTGMYRMDNINNWSNNDSMLFQYAGLNHYSSNEKNFVLRFLQKLGLNFTNLYIEYENGSTQTVDSLLGVRYLLAEEASINKEYEKIYETQEGNVYRNNAALPLFFMADEDILKVDMAEKNPFVLQENMLYAIEGEQSDTASVFQNQVFCEADRISFRVNNAVQSQKDGILHFEQIREDEPIELEYRLKVKGDGRLFAYATDGNRIQNAEVYVDDRFVSGYFNYDCWKILNLGYYQEGDELQVCIHSNSPALVLEQIYFATEDYATLQKITDQIKDEKVEYSRCSSSHFKANVENDNRKTLVFTVPYEDSWRVKVDGKLVDITKVYDTLLAVNLEPGNHSIEYTYRLKGWYAGITITLVSILCLLVLHLFYKKKAADMCSKCNRDGLE